MIRLIENASSPINEGFLLRTIIYNAEYNYSGAFVSRDLLHIATTNGNKHHTLSQLITKLIAKNYSY